MEDQAQLNPAVERMAKAIYRALWDGPLILFDWDELVEADKDRFRRAATLASIGIQWECMTHGAAQAR